MSLRRLLRHVDLRKTAFMAQLKDVTGAIAAVPPLASRAQASTSGSLPVSTSVKVKIERKLQVYRFLHLGTGGKGRLSGTEAIIVFFCGPKGYKMPTVVTSPAQRALPGLCSVLHFTTCSSVLLSERSRDLLVVPSSFASAHVLTLILSVGPQEHEGDASSP